MNTLNHTMEFGVERSHFLEDSSLNLSKTNFCHLQNNEFLKDINKKQGKICKDYLNTM